MTPFNGNPFHRMNDSIWYDRLLAIISDYEAENKKLRRERADLKRLNEKLWDENRRLRHAM